jgi:hypothetical protein
MRQTCTMKSLSTKQHIEGTIMAMELNYDPSEVRTSKVRVASAAASGVVFGFISDGTKESPSEAVAIAPAMARMNNLRIGELIDVSYVPNFPEHAHRVQWRAVAVYRDEQREAAKPAAAPQRQTLEQQVQDLVMGGEVWNRPEVYVDLYNERFDSSTASEVQRTRYDAVGAALQRLHDTSILACAKVYAPGKKHATAVYYAKSTHVLGRALMGLDVPDQEGEA